MRSRNYRCPNGCKLPQRVKQLREIEEGIYGFEYPSFPYCPVCGEMMPYTQKKIKDFLDVFHVHPKLEKSVKLLYKSEFVSAAREAVVTVETVLKSKSGLDSHGESLASNALVFSYDQKTAQITKQPLIAVNKLETDSERNEQKGLMFMLMGFFTGIRNIYQHSHVGSGVSNSIATIIQASFFLNILDGKSITKKGEWIKTNINYGYIYNHMPKLTDRIRLRLLLSRRNRRNQAKTEDIQESEE